MMRERRGMQEVKLLCAGPGRVGQALGIVHAFNGHRLDQAPFEVRASPGGHEVVVGPRIGISKAADVPWRFGLAGSRFLSRRF
jgi:DNA-3-methyladenine glycosylase